MYFVACYNVSVVSLAVNPSLDITQRLADKPLPSSSLRVRASIAVDVGAGQKSSEAVENRSLSDLLSFNNRYEINA